MRATGIAAAMLLGACATVSPTLLTGNLAAHLGERVEVRGMVAESRLGRFVAVDGEPVFFELPSGSPAVRDGESIVLHGRLRHHDEVAPAPGEPLFATIPAHFALEPVELVDR